MEMLKLMVAEGAAVAVTAMADGGLLLPIFGGVAYTGPLGAMISAERLLGWKPDAIRRLAALAVAVTEDAKRVATRLRLTNAEAKALDSMGHRWWRLVGMDEATARRRLYRLGAERYCDRLHAGVGARRQGSTDPARWRELARRCRWRAPKFPLKAADFIARGVIEGPAARAGARAGRRRLAGGGIFPGPRRAQNHRRPRRGAFYPRYTDCEYHFRLRRYFLVQLLLVACVALFAAVVGGLAGYGTGALMPLVLVPLIGAEPVVCRSSPSPRSSPISAASPPISVITDRRRALIVILAAGSTTALGAYGYTRAHKCRRGAGDRRHAAIERAAASIA